MASKAISDYLTMPPEMQFKLLIAAQNGDLSLEAKNAKVEQIASSYWSGEDGLGSGLASIFPFRRTASTGNFYIIHKDALLYIKMLFTGTNLEYLYECEDNGVKGGASQELKDELKAAVILKNHKITLSGPLKCEALSKIIRGHEEITPEGGIEVDAENPLLGSAVFNISNRTFDRLTREDEAARKELEEMAALNSRRHRKQFV